MLFLEIVNCMNFASLMTIVNYYLYFLILKDITGWGENDRGVSFTFGGDVVKEFLKKHNFSLIVRAHQVLTSLVEYHMLLQSGM